jgi:hypothetical protein
MSNDNDDYLIKAFIVTHEGKPLVSVILDENLKGLEKGLVE